MDDVTTLERRSSEDSAPFGDGAGNFMLGTWVGSFAGFVHDDPIDTHEPAPQIDAYLLQNNHYTQTHGYFLASTILCLKFDAEGKISGKVRINRGGSKIVKQDHVTGTYDRSWNDSLEIIEGTFSTTYPHPTDPQFDIHITYYFIAKTQDEIEWLWMKSFSDGEPFRGSVARGTLTRVLYGPQPVTHPFDNDVLNPS